ncbi:MAG: (Fe-S)-binding protein [Gammaproteobacteria bacterium]|nr:(Fe-S)-binding protein [Gammaproteobacteria bacterium]MBU1968797.1 (Fe-S)-binding protein [Gammaproteobacteria bacterium]
MSATLEKGLNAFKEVIDTPIASYFSSCVHCGLCAEACLFHNETGDPKYTPIHKLEPLRRVWKQEYTLLGRLGKMLGLSRPVTDAELTEWEPLVYDSCTLCGRCSMVCPVGNDITYMIRKMREGMSASGHAPEDMKAATTRAINIGSPMGIKWPAVQAQIGHVQAETGIEVPVDVQGADYLVLMSSMEIINFPEYLSAISRIFKQAGVNWTLAPDAFEATNSGIQIGASDLAREIVSRIVVAAERLKVKCVISPECGHAFTALRWEGPNLMGKPYSFDVKHILEVLDDLHRAGKIKTKGKDKRPLTYHDPCQIARRGGVVEQPRHLLGEVAEDFREMPDAGVMNWCCGGGGGVSANSRAEPLRLEAFKVKKRQIESTGVHTLITACANCRIVMEEGLEHYHMKVEVLGLTELLAEYLVEGE